MTNLTPNTKTPDDTTPNTPAEEQAVAQCCAKTSRHVAGCHD